MRRRRRMTDLITAAGIAVAVATAACGGGPTSPARARPTYALSGVVTGPPADGRVPVEGAVVRHLEGGRAATTDSTGSYSIPDLPAGTGTVTVSKDGYGTATHVVTLTADARLDVELARPPSPPAIPASTLSGTVYEQTPTGRVIVEGVRVEESYRHIVSATDRNGRFSFSMDDVELGRFDGFVQLYVTRDGFQTLTRNAVVYGDTHLDIEIVRR